MEQDIKTTLRNACQALLRPIASVLLRSGMTWKEFSDISKTVFVSVASDEFGIRGRPTNVSRASILTGISRKEVKRQRDLIDAATPASSSKTTDATRLLSGWHQDPDYIDTDGQPLPLPASGPAPSFESLFEIYGGDTPEQTLIKELSSAGSIEGDSDGNFCARRRYHMPANMDVGNIRFFGTNLFDHAQTLSNNLAQQGEARRLEGFAVDDRIHPDAVDAFTRFVDQKGQQFLEEIDAWLSQQRVDADDTQTTPVRLGLGVYAIQGSLPKGTLS
jgi:hypothetical protein